MKLRYFLTLSLMALCLCWVAVASAEEAPTPTKIESSLPNELGIILGDPKAALAMDLYIDLSCHHCADLVKNTLPTIKKEYVDTGKVRIVFHDVIKNGVDLKVASLMTCLSPEKYWQLASLLYKEQEKWTELEDPLVYVRKVTALAGMDQETFDKCINDQEKQKKLAKKTVALSKTFKRLPTPMIMIGDSVYKGKMSVEELRKIIDKHLTMTNNQVN